MKSFRLFKTVTLSLLFLILSVCALMFAFNAKTVQATSPVFEMDKGVYVKLVDDGGLRFRVKMDETTKAGIDGEGNELFFLLMSQEKFDAANGDFSAVDCTKIPADKSLIYYSQDDACYYSNLLIYNIPENMRTEYLCVVAGKTVDGVTTFASYESATQVCKTFYNAVNASLVDLGIAEILNVYTWLGTANYPVAIETETQFNTFVDIINSEEVDASLIKSVELKKWVDYRDSIFTNEEFDPLVITCTDESVTIVKNKTEFFNALNVIYTATTDEANPVNIKLGADIVFEESAGQIYPAKSSALYGTIDGRGYAIKNMKINTSHSSYAVGGGLFGSVYGEIKDLALINVTLDNGGQGGSAGVICSTLQNGGVISNVFVSGTVLNIGNNCGGIIFKHVTGGTIKNCIASLETNNTKDYSSVIVKDISGGSMSNCYAISSTYKHKAVQYGGKLYANNAEFLADVTSLPADKGWNSYWTLTGDSLKFGDEEVLAIQVLDITSNFIFANGYSFCISTMYGAIGSAKTGMSSYKGNDSLLDVSNYAKAGKSLRITMPKSAGYGLVFFDANKVAGTASGWYFNNSSNEDILVMTIPIPADAHYVKTTYFSDTKLATLANPIPFSAQIIG